MAGLELMEGSHGELAGEGKEEGEGRGWSAAGGLGGEGKCQLASARRMVATRQRRAAVRARRGTRRLTSGARSSVISE
jgi:hypothetical protein